LILEGNNMVVPVCLAGWQLRPLLVKRRHSRSRAIRNHFFKWTGRRGTVTRWRAWPTLVYRRCHERSRGAWERGSRLVASVDETASDRAATPPCSPFHGETGQIFYKISTVVLSFVFDKYCPIMD